MGLGYRLGIPAAEAIALKARAWSFSAGDEGLGAGACCNTTCAEACPQRVISRVTMLSMIDRILQ